MTGSTEISVTDYLKEWEPVGESLIHQIDFDYSWFISIWHRYRDGSYAIVTQAGFHPTDFMICDRRRFYHKKRWLCSLPEAIRLAQEELESLQVSQPLEEKYRDFLKNRSN